MIPGNSIKAVRGRGPSLREGVGGGGILGRMMFDVRPSIKGTVNSYMKFRSPVMFSDKAYKISGITKDSTGAVLGGCLVSLFYTQGDTLICKMLSDATTGEYSFGMGPSLDCYVVAYKAGAPDVAGTTVNTLVGA